MSRSPFERLPRVLVKKMTSYLPSDDVLKLTRTSRVNYSIFQSIANELKTLTAVAHGNQDNLISLIKRTMKNHPELLFEKRPVKDPSGCFFYSVSAYQLMTFLCDDVMKSAIMPLIPPTMELRRKHQYEELGRGGADLIKMDKAPELIKDFQVFREVRTTITIFEKQEPVTFSLLENPDGIIFYQDEHNKVHLYYVNQDTEALQRLEPKAFTVDAQRALDTLIASFMAMEPNSGRRSSDAEHSLIQQTMKITLHRESIRYERDGVCFQDSRTEFRQINKYRTCMRLYGGPHGDWGKADKFWREEVGNAQGEVMWVLQRICEKGRIFNKVPNNFNGFKREFNYENGITGETESVFSNGKLAPGLGKDFCLSVAGKMAMWGWRSIALAAPRGAGGEQWLVPRDRALGGARRDLIAVCRLVESAKAKVVEEFKPSQDLEPRGASPK